MSYFNFPLASTIPSSLTLACPTALGRPSPSDSNLELIAARSSRTHILSDSPHSLALSRRHHFRSRFSESRCPID